MPRAFALSLPATLGQEIIELSQPKPAASDPADACEASVACPQPYEVPQSQLPSLTLHTESSLPAFAQLLKKDPPPAGPVTLPHPSSADRPAGALPVLDVAPARLPLQLPPSMSSTRQFGPVKLCGAAAGLAAQVVEAFLPPAAEPLAIPYPAATRLPLLNLAAADWTVAAGIAESVEAPPAQAVESFLPLVAQTQAIPYAISTALPHLPMQASDWQLGAELAHAAKSPAADAVESFLSPAAEPRMLPFPSASAMLPALSVTVAELTVEPVDLAEAVAGPAAQPVEAWLPATEPLMAPFATSLAMSQFQLTAAELTVEAVDVAEAVGGPAAQPVEAWLPATEPLMAPFAARAALPVFSLLAADWMVAGDLAEAAAGPGAQPVEAWLTASQSSMAPFAAVTIQPVLSLTAAEWVVTADLAEAVAGPAAQPVESWLPFAAAPLAAAFPAPALCLPEWSLTAAEPETLRETDVIAPPSDASLPGLPVSEVVREVIPFVSPNMAVLAGIETPSLAVAMGQPAIRWSGGWRCSAAPEPVFSYVTPRLHEVIPAALTLSLPTLQARHIARPAVSLAPASEENNPKVSEPSQSAAPFLVESRQGERDRQSQPVQFPRFAVQYSAGNVAADFHSAEPPAVEPQPAETSVETTLPTQTPDLAARSVLPAAALSSGLPQPGFVPPEFFFQRQTYTPVRNLEIRIRPLALQPPKFVVRPIFERIDEAEPRKPERKPPAFAEIFTITEAARKRASGNQLGSAGKAIAASLLVGIGLWFGAGSARIARQLLTINSSLPALHDAGNSSSGDDTSASNSSPIAAARNAAPQAPHGAIATVRRVIQQRAAVELTDTFRRMEAWGATAKALPAGWSRHADGYVQTGQLALYHPAQAFVDYHFEFYGQIEKKSMSWAVRARDTQNYYAMKFTVVEPGLRPVIAAVHYPVIGGKKGQLSQTPLSMMIHNQTAYHVAVDVKGNKVTTSIEGQEVDSFTDDALKAGGVGFFSEVGESARLYWVRVTKNQDWLGRVCAYLSSGSGTNTAELWRGDFPAAPSQPTQPPVPANTDVTLAAIDIEEFSFTGPQRARILKYGRTEICRS